MFSPSELLHLVFANENDTYYCDNLLKLDLNQYLWMKLHETYRSVFFLHREEKGFFSVRSFGETEKYVPSRGVLGLFGGKSEKDKFGAWMTRQLRAKQGEAAAFVCSLEDFCDVLRGSEWNDVLQSIASLEKRTGIFVLTVPTQAERSMGLFLESPVFAKLGETAVSRVQGGALRELYLTLKNSKPGSSVFLNAFTQSRVRALLLHVIFASPQRFSSQEDLDDMAEYLTQYMNNRALRRQEPLFDGGQLGANPQYQELFRQLQKDAVWQDLARQSRRAAEEGGVQAYLARRGWDCWEESGNEVCITRDKDSYGGKCVLLWPDAELWNAGTEGETVAGLLEEIQRAVLSPRNRPENGRVIQAVLNQLSQLEAAQAERDTDTCLRVLYAIRFCVSWIHVESDSQEEKEIFKTVNLLEPVIQLSRNCFLQRRNLERNQLLAGSGTMTDASLRQLREKTEAGERLLRSYEDMMRASIVNLSLSPSNDSITELAEGIDKILRVEPESKPKQEPELTHQEDPEEYDFVIRPEDYRATPS